MLLQTVIEVAFNFCFESSLKSATDLLPQERQIQQDVWGSARALHVSFNNASTRTVRKWLKIIKDHLVALQIWISWRAKHFYRQAEADLWFLVPWARFPDCAPLS